jgi:hypothetical protein
MEGHRCRSFGMNPKLPKSRPHPSSSNLPGTRPQNDRTHSGFSRRTVLCLLALLLPVCGAMMVLAQSSPSLPKGRFTSFVFPEYHEPPHETQLKSTLKGDEAVPQPDGSLHIQGLRVETYGVNGEPGFVLEADECEYHNQQGRAWSPGRIRMRTADERFTLEGFGFLWQAGPSILTISNRVHTVIRGGMMPLKQP